MQHNNLKHTKQLNIKPVIAGMLVVFIIVHVGFNASYIKHFPAFTQFSWIHHTHGALMGCWVLLLVVQPILIYKKRSRVHRFLGKLTYALAPLIVVSMFFVAKENYQTGILKKTWVDVMAIQSITWMQLFMFVLFYALAIYNKKFTYTHMRFIIGTAIVMLGPPLNRILISYFPEIGAATILPLVLYIKTALVAALFLTDVAKKQNWKPYFIVLVAFVFADVVYHARYSDAWQAFGNFVVHKLYN